MTTHVTNLICIHCGRVASSDQPRQWMTCDACGPRDGLLDIHYDLSAVRQAWHEHPLAARPQNHWRYHELLPLEAEAIPWHWTVGWTPLIDAPRLTEELELKRLILKDEGRNPTASFKDRASSVGVSHALSLQARTVACASTGNAATSLAGHAALAGLSAVIFVPETAPEPKLAQLLIYGATVVVVQGSYDQAYDLCGQACARFGWYNRNCAINPVLVEGKKTGGLELAEQCRELSRQPWWVAVSVGDGCTLAGIWKGLVEMHQLHVIDHLPRMLGVQAAEVAPVEFALRNDILPASSPGTTLADSINVPVPRNWRKAVRAIRQSQGAIVCVSDDEILQAMRRTGAEGVFAEPAAAAAVAGICAAPVGCAATRRCGGRDDYGQRPEGHSSGPACRRRTAARAAHHGPLVRGTSQLNHRSRSYAMPVKEDVLARTAQLFRERKILVPTFQQLRDPTGIPLQVQNRLSSLGLWELDPLNLFRITWKNEPVARGGLFNQGNWLEFPPELTGVPARILGLVGKFFPTGAHKVGAAFGCLIPRLVSGEFDPTRQKAVWPSTGNYCRGGAFDSALLGCTAVAILPEEMSRERFEWLEQIGAEVIATPGCESNVKEIYDKCWEIRRTRPECVIFNQFEEFGNSVWHYHVTGGMIDEIFSGLDPGHRLAAFVSATGSAGTIAAGDFLRTRYPHLRVVAAEAQQCPTLFQLGFGGHRIEGIGDKHVPWIHNVRNTDMVTAIDDEQCLTLFRLFNEPAGQECLLQDLPADLVRQLPLLGISCICNLVAAIKTAKYYDLDEQDVVFMCLTDSAELYASRLAELTAARGAYTLVQAGADRWRYLDGIAVDWLRELTYADRKALHHFKYFTWVEQQGRTADELRQLWRPEFWEQTYAQVDEWDRQIDAFNARTGVLQML